MIRIKKGLDIPIYGSPADNIVDSKITRSVAVLGNDYIGMKPTMLVEEGDSVKLGQALFEDKKNPGVIITSPAGGKICLLYTSPSPRDKRQSRMPSSA